jgi:oxepin-CoA hydrolase/3-oxo-5,6-dehydrosuberyl-CoA semialdehyde dehydrogenase
VEADSLNAAVLGPDLEYGSDVYFAAQRNIVTEMTQKAGQKCTAIRRIFVPEGLVDALQEAICAELDRVVVGDPRTEGVTMGPLATASQLRDYREGVELLQQEAEIVYGTTDPIGDRGFMAGPVLLRASNGGGAHVHSHEVFGPVATLIPYDGSASTAAALVARGEGSLACSVYSSDKAFLSELLPELLTFNGRVLVVDKKVADTATGHGMVLPQLNHGGPGRAGGGGELGALRGLEHYMQRSAVQGNKALLERLLS